MSVNKWKMYFSEESERYCIYFTINLVDFYKTDQNYYLFKFSIASNLAEDFRVSIEKRYSDFSNFDRLLSRQVKAKIPQLPKKRILQSDQAMRDRGSQLVEWLTVISNDKMYHTDILFTFLAIPKNIATIALDFPHLEQLRSVTCKVMNHSSVNTQEENFVVYNMKVEVFDRKTNERISDHWIGRRFREFSSLHDILKYKFSHYKISLPELPSRMKPFSSIDTRQNDLNIYINRLLSYEDILECIHFRKFLSVDSSVMRN